jgi:hypothetical protein
MSWAEDEGIDIGPPDRESPSVGLYECEYRTKENKIATVYSMSEQYLRNSYKYWVDRDEEYYARRFKNELERREIILGEQPRTLRLVM